MFTARAGANVPIPVKALKSQEASWTHEWSHWILWSIPKWIETVQKAGSGRGQGTGLQMITYVWESKRFLE